MIATLDEVAKAVLEFPAAQRAALAHKLIESLDEEVDENAAALWRQEIDRRIQEIEDGKVVCRPFDDVLQELRAKLA
jgi:putative addiction module component (TIGR02574 family)